MKIAKPEPFEKPEGGAYTGLLIDIVEKPNQPITFGGVTKMQDQVTFTWVLGDDSGNIAKDSKGRPYLIFESYNAYIAPPNGNKKASKLYIALTQILNAAPPVIDDVAQLEPLLLNRPSGLLVMKGPKATNPNDFTSKIIGHTPLKAGQKAPTKPAEFKRQKDRAQQAAGPNPGHSQPPAEAAPSVDLNDDNEAF